MNEDDLEAQKLEIMQALATFSNGKISDLDVLMSKCKNLSYNRKLFNEVLDFLVKEYLVRIIPYEVATKRSNVYELTERAKTKYGIDIPYESYYKPREYKPPQVVNIVNSAGVIVGTADPMTKGTLRAILSGICIFTIIAIVVLIFLSG